MGPNNLKYRAASLIKSIIYGQRGEPYRLGNLVLRYAPGTRPVRLKYKNSTNDNVANDALQVEFLYKSLREGHCAIDIGAHAGQYSLLMAALCGPSGSVYSFEPDPYARKLFRRTFELNPGIKFPILEELACSDSACETVLFSKGGNSQSSLARSAVEFDETQAEMLSIRTTTLDLYLAKHNVKTPHWVKIDAEGAEIRILKGATSLLSTDCQIICELHPYAWREFENNFDELLAVVQTSGRKMCLLKNGQDVRHNPSYCTVLIERC